MFKSIRNLISDSLNANSKVSAKRISLLTSQFLFGLQIFMDIILHAVILVWVTPKPDVEFYKVMASVQGLALILNAVNIWWHLGAIKSTEIAGITSAAIVATKPKEKEDTQEIDFDDYRRNK